MSVDAGAKAGAGGLRMHGAVDLAAPPEAVYRVLLDPVALAQVIPGCHALREVGQHRYRAEVTLGIGLVKARYDAEIVLSELDPPRGLRLAGRGTSGIGTAEGTGTVVLAPSGTGTRLTYDYTVSVGGKVAAVGSRMLEGAARIVLKQLFEALGRQAVGSGTIATPTATPLAPGFWRRLLRRLGFGR